ncbi:MAG: FHA domain-containing protein [Candidatus Eremiobacteraeota bacterium]|nr:FHA domain-containing protein [Candidatus Eremiobacteraeota bacterium]MBV8498658.1 FHA domain-containing protein [Candidatus Eremiobacteraeota bacterium]
MTLEIAAAAGFEQQMRIGSLEITAALALVAVLTARLPARTAAEIGRVTPVRLRLEILERGATRSYEGRPPLELGRDKGTEIVLRDPEVSRRHARFESQDGVVFVEDLKSSNGTYLNGRRVTEAIEVRQGDEIDVGTTRIVVRSVRPG